MGHGAAQQNQLSARQVSLQPQAATSTNLHATQLVTGPMVRCKPARKPACWGLSLVGLT